MNGPLLDSNVLLDILVRDPVWYPWSSKTVAALLDAGNVFVNPIVYAEVSVGFERIEAIEAALPRNLFRRVPLPWEATFLAGKAFLRYRRSGGQRRSPLPDFYIGAHAAVMRMPLVTRDPRRYRSYFPSLDIITPDTNV